MSTTMENDTAVVVKGKDAHFKQAALQRVCQLTGNLMTKDTAHWALAAFGERVLEALVKQACVNATMDKRCTLATRDFVPGLRQIFGDSAEAMLDEQQIGALVKSQKKKRKQQQQDGEGEEKKKKKKKQPAKAPKEKKPKQKKAAAAKKVEEEEAEDVVKEEEEEEKVKEEVVESDDE